ncbi:hypothetical protein POVWA2_021980 [Plasmodium ovale wallikeri]|uniref:Uncharacterized protein n=1 Tax=Plasmodium ovale wallikeri TaxID=864142 RepID=A0A1A8YRY9_PLAOA|nr:hypothetical protein POVWA1_022160 [Plasmodium ovale wallikeri]SBT34856.1 hypothetical protein POVWA2_021980 [Plasmodium ovale wallikeri]
MHGLKSASHPSTLPQCCLRGALKDPQKRSVTAERRSLFPRETSPLHEYPEKKHKKKKKKKKNKVGEGEVK